MTTAVELFRGTWRALKGEAPGRTFGIAMTWVGTYALLVLVALLALLQNTPEMPADRALFTTVSAASNVGLSHDALSVTRDNVYALCAAMLLGRFLPIAVLWWMAMTTRDADVAVG